MTAETHAPAILVRERSCGECQVCCINTIIDLPEIQKQNGAPCRHSLKGCCDIYESRPDTCRTFYCGWRRSKEFPDDWRPDRSGIFAILENFADPQFAPVKITLFLTGNPLETIRRPDFIEFVARNVQSSVAMNLMLPGARGNQSVGVALNLPHVLDAAGRSREDVRPVLEMLLQRLQARPPTPYTMKNSGNDVSA